MKMGKGGITPRSTVLTDEILESIGEYMKHQKAAMESERLAREALDKAAKSYVELNSSSEDTKPNPSPE